MQALRAEIEGITFDYGPEWKAYTPEERAARSRAGPPLSPLYRGITSIVAPRRRDEESLRLVRAQQAARQPQGIDYVLEELRALDEPEYVKETAALILRKMYSVNPQLFKRSNRERYVAAAVHIARRLHGLPTSRSVSLKTIKKIVDTLGIRYTTRRKRDVALWIYRVVESLGLGMDVARLAMRIYEENTILSSGRARTVAAALVYIAGNILGYNVSQASLAKIVSTAVVSIRYTARRLRVVYLLPCINAKRSWPLRGDTAGLPTPAYIEQEQGIRIKTTHIRIGKGEIIVETECEKR